MLKDKNEFVETASNLENSEKILKEFSGPVLTSVKSLRLSYFDFLRHLQADTKEFDFIIQAVSFLLDSLKDDKRYGLLCTKVDSAKQHLEILAQTIDMVDSGWKDLCHRIGVSECELNFNKGIDDKTYVQPALVEHKFSDQSEPEEGRKPLSEEEVLLAIDEFRRSIREVKKIMPVATSRYTFFLGQYFDLKLLKKLWLEKISSESTEKLDASSTDVEYNKEDSVVTDSSGNADKVCSTATVDGRISV
jgi:hypothetical protein